jgi:hypothetical protein
MGAQRQAVQSDFRGFRARNKDRPFLPARGRPAIGYTARNANIERFVSILLESPGRGNSGHATG